MDPVAQLATVIASGRASLFTGAGFSSDARDREGQSLPDSAAMTRELWPLVFEGGDPDDSSLADLYDVALARVPEQLAAYLARRLTIGDAPLPTHYRAWFAAPWRRVYTLNVDDLDVAVARQFALPRPLRSISATARDAPPPRPGALDVVHLNGIAGAPTELTFSTMQYAARLCGRDREYERLVEDLDRSPFVFTGTTLDEVVLWQHVELRRRANGGASDRPPAFLISPSLSRARQALLETLGILWLQGTSAELASRLFG